VETFCVIGFLNIFLQLHIFVSKDRMHEDRYDQKYTVVQFEIRGVHNAVTILLQLSMHIIVVDILNTCDLLLAQES
jgi:hypothetical protein